MGALLLFDDFEWGADGDRVDASGGSTAWSLAGTSGGANLFEIDTDQAHGGTRSLKIYAGNENNPSVAATLSGQDNAYEIVTWARAQSGITWYLLHGDGTKRVNLYRSATTGKLVIGQSGGSSLATNRVLNPDEWYEIRVANIFFTSGTYSVYVNGQRVTEATMVSSAYSPNQLQLRTSTSGGACWFDDVQVEQRDTYSWPQRFPINFAPPAVTDAAVIYVEADWDRDGDFDADYEDITSSVMGFVVEYGRDEWLEDAIVGTAEIVLHDASGTYISYNTSSQIVATHGGIYPGTPIRIRVTKTSNYWLFNGFLDDVLPNPKKSVKEAVLKCVDGLEQLKNVQISTGIKENVYSGGVSGLVHLALDQAKWPWAQRNVDTNENDAYDIIYVDDKQCLNFVNELAQSEFAFCYVDNYGDFCWEDRYYRLLTARSVSSQWVCSEDKYINIEPTNSLKSIYNKVVIKAQPKRATTGLSSIWALTENASSNNSISITAGDTKTFWASFQAEDDQTPNIAKDVQVPSSASGDYAGNSAQDGSGDDMTASLSVSTTIFAASAMVRVKNTHATDSVYLTNCRLRGNIYKDDPPLKVVQENTSSQALYSMGIPRTWERELAYYQGFDTLNGMALNILSAKEEPSKGFTVNLINKDDEVYTQMLARHVSDKITLQNSDYMISGDFYIEKIRHEMEKGQGGKVVRTEWRLLDAAAIGGVFWILDTSQLGDGYLYPTRLAY